MATQPRTPAVPAVPPGVIPAKIHGQPTWDPTTSPPLTQRPLGSSQPPTSAPRAPGQSGSGAKTVVNTQALATFADNINQLIAPVQAAHQDVLDLKPVAAGAFDKAWAISGAVTGGGPSSQAAPMQKSFGTVLLDLRSGLTDLHAAATKMGTIYTTADSMNHMSAGDLQDMLEQSSTDFSGIVGGGQSKPG